MEGQKVITDGLEFVQSIKEFRAIDGPVDPHCYKLITAAHHHRLIFVALDDQQIGAVPNNEILNPPSISRLSCLAFTLQVTFRPTIISVAQNGFSSLLMVVGIDNSTSSPMMEFFDIDARKSVGKLALPDEYRGTEIIDYAWHPKYHESILALCTRRGDLLIVVIKRQDSWASLVYKEKQYLALTCCWSPKGKNLAIGTVDGQIMRLEPVITASTFTFKEVENGRILLSNIRISMEHKLIKLRWIKAKLLICVHAKLDDQEQPDTIYSILTLKQPEPHFYWTSLCSENPKQHYNVQIVNLTNSVICLPNTSGEVAILSAMSEEKSNEPSNWTSVWIEEERARLELPLDGNKLETFPRGVTVALLDTINPDVAKYPVLVVYGSDGVLRPFAAIQLDNLLEIPQCKELEDCPFSVCLPVVTIKQHETIAEETNDEIDLDRELNITPMKRFPRESIGHWSVERKKNNMSVKAMVEKFKK